MQLIQPGDFCPAPNVCFLCESRPTESAIIDTGRNSFADTVPPHPLQGRKLVCSLCAENLGVAVGMMKAAEAAEAVEDLAFLTGEVEQLRIEVEELRGEAIEKFRVLVEGRTFNRPGPKPKTAA